MYILLEMQTNGTQTALVPPTTYSDKNEAESAFYHKVGYAAVSTVNVHSVVLLDEHGNVALSKYYEHNTEPEPAPEPDAS